MKDAVNQGLCPLFWWMGTGRQPSDAALINLCADAKHDAQGTCLAAVSRALCYVPPTLGECCQDKRKQSRHG